MDVKNNVKKRREERIRELLGREEQALRLYTQSSYPEDFEPYREAGQPARQQPVTSDSGGMEERDPELMWKQGRGLWREDAFNAPIAGRPPGPGGTRFAGYDPGTSGERYDAPRKGSFFRAFMTRTLISAVLFGGLWGIHRYHPSWSAPLESYVTASLHQEMDFQAAEAWYERNFGGAPSFIPIFGSKSEPQQLVQSAHGFTIPIEGKLAESFAISLKGVEIIPELDSSGIQEVKSVETGRVTEVSDDALTGRTVVVQHSGGYVSVYGRLTEVSVSKGDWLEGGESVGRYSRSGGSDTVYFAIKKDGLYIDPAEVVPLD
ncbi:M23 family metallopeptidase [Paenibacillus pinistramenti]|uniref:M23 family metallopeptidase n=1 Tax=Paenibacillus pinistramenti TaxID=1768003 RepID=UPI001109E166|nr:M23 family metallopeptidase [Paenibacillus pinistramenti]